MKGRFLLLTACFPAMLSFCCKEQPPEPGSGLPLLAVEDVSCTEVWLRLLFADGIPYHQVTLTRDGCPLLTSAVRATDTVIVDDGLLPSHSYSYDLTVMGVFAQHTVVQARTMDTTSHNFTWEIDTLGIGNSSKLFDVAIINDTLSYAVGEVYIRDSLGNFDPNAYNAVKWDGMKWELKRIRYIGPCGGGVDYPPQRGVWAFSDTNILMTDGGSIVWYDRLNVMMDCGMHSFLVGAINKIYAGSPQEICAVGNAGTIALSSNGTWRNVSSGTSVDLQDVWGGSNRYVGNQVTLIAASNKYTAGEEKLLRINKSGLLDTIPWPMSLHPLHSVWFDSYSRVYVCGGGVFIYLGGSRWKKVTEIPPIFTNRIRGNGVNDIFVVGDFGIVAHFNGMTWHVYPEVALPAGNYESLAMKGNMVVAVGWTGSRAIVLGGSR